FPGLVRIVSATTGHDHIDLSALEERGIQLTSLRGQEAFLQTIPSTAEHTWALLLALIRNLPAANEDVKGGNWNRDAFRGYQLKGKTIGIVGYGRTGKKVAEYARAFEMKVIFFDPFVTESTDEKVDALDTLLRRANIVSFHVHLTDATVHLLDKSNIQSLTKGAYLINTSRGKIWDEVAVSNAVRSSLVRG